jgi:predicted amidohydrolase
MIRIAIIHASYELPPEGLVNEKGLVSEKKNTDLIEANLGKTMDMLHEAGQRNAGIAITNEDFANLGRFGRHINEPDLFAKTVRKHQDFIAEQISGIAKEYNMLIAANEYESDGKNIYNTTNLYGRDGSLIGKYRKVHLPSGERFKVQPAPEPAGVFVTDIGTIGFATCYDIIFPEHCRGLALQGADIIIHQTQGFGCMGGGQTLITSEGVLRTRAIENCAYLVVAKNLFGEGGFSCVIDNNGNPVSKMQSPVDHVFITDIDPDFNMIDPYDYDTYYAGTDSVRTRRFLFRRPEMYGKLTEEVKPPYVQTEEEWVEGIRKLETLDPAEHAKYHW